MQDQVQANSEEQQSRVFFGPNKTVLIDGVPYAESALPVALKKKVAEYREIQETLAELEIDAASLNAKMMRSQKDYADVNISLEEMALEHHEKVTKTPPRKRKTSK